MTERKETQNATPEVSRPSSQAVQREAMLTSTDENYHNASTFEAMMARVSAEVTRVAAERKKAAEKQH